MFWQYLLALALFQSPVDVPVSQQIFDYLAPSLRQVVVDLELADKGNKDFTQFKNFKDDLIRLRILDDALAECPRIQDLERFPKPEHVEQCRNFNRRYRENLEARLYTESNFLALQMAIEETRTVDEPWKHLWDAHNEPWIVRRREALRDLHQKIGHKAYYSGMMPTYVPLWRFKLMD